MQIIAPGSSSEFDKLFKDSYKQKNPLYCRLSDYENKFSFKVNFGKANFINKKSKTTILAVGPVLNFVLPIIKSKKVNLIYLTTIRPFDKKITANLKKNKIRSLIIIEPFYSGTIISEIIKNYNVKELKIKIFSVPFKFLTNYGKKYQHDKKIGFTDKSLIKYISSNS